MQKGHAAKLRMAMVLIGLCYLEKDYFFLVWRPVSRMTRNVTVA